jgi:hypothetical protein
MPYARPPCKGSRHVQYTPLHGMRVFGIELQAAAFFALVRKVGTETAARPSRWCTVAPTRGAVCLHPKLTHPIEPAVRTRSAVCVGAASGTGRDGRKRPEGIRGGWQG